MVKNLKIYFPTSNPKPKCETGEICVDTLAQRLTEDENKCGLKSVGQMWIKCGL